MIGKTVYLNGSVTGPIGSGARGRRLCAELRKSIELLRVLTEMRK